MLRHVISLSCFCSFAHLPFQLVHAFRQIIVLERTGRSRNEAMRDVVDEKADHLLVPAYTADGNQAKPNNLARRGLNQTS